MDFISLLLLVSGGINWELIGIFQFDLVTYFFLRPVGCCQPDHLCVRRTCGDLGISFFFFNARSCLHRDEPFRKSAPQAQKKAGSFRKDPAVFLQLSRS